MRRLVFSALSLALLGAAVAVACGGPSGPVPCSEIPDGGCPLIDPTLDECGGADSVCSAIYSCVNGGWVLHEVCPPVSADAGPDGAADASDDGSPDALLDGSLDAPFDAGFVLPPGAYGGGLQCPASSVDIGAGDCSVGTAVVPGACCFSDQDMDCCLFAYTCEDAGWVAWGTCIDGGLVPLR